MKAAQVVARGKVEFVEMTKPALIPGHALVRTRQLSLCGSDIFYIDYQPDAAYPCPPGSTGHEMVGFIEEIDILGSALKAGDAVLALVPDHTAMTEYVVVPEHYLFKLPDDIPMEQMLQAQQLGTVIYACKHLPNIVGKNVAIIGQGSAGLWFNYMISRLGAHNVIGIDLQAHRLQISNMYGATHTIHNADVDPLVVVKEILGGELPEVVIEAGGEPETIRMAVDLIAQDGFILYFGVPHVANFDFPYGDLYMKTCTAKTIVGATREAGQISTQQALDLIARGDIDVAPAITHRFPFEQLLDAYDLQRTRDEGAIKILVEMPE